MKKVNLFLSILMISFLAIGTSCTKDETTPAAPTVTLTPTATSLQITQDTSLVYSVALVAEGKIKSFVITEVNNGTTIPTDKTSECDGETSYTYAFTKTITYANVGSSGMTITFAVTDESDQKTEKTITITKKSNTNVLKTAQTIVLGAQNNTTGSFAVALDGTVYTTTQLKANNYANSANVDLIYYYGNTGLNSIYSPSNSTIQGITWGGLIDWANWNTKRNTEFVSATANDYTNASYSSVAAVNYTTATTSITQIQANDVYFFKTEDGKYGVFKVNSVANADNGQISISVKIQE